MKIGIALGMLVMSTWAAVAVSGAADPGGNLLRKWSPFGNAGATQIGENGLIVATCREEGDAAGVSQVLEIAQKEISTLTFSVACRATAVTARSKNDFGIYLDLTHSDGSRTPGVTLPFPPGTYDFQTLTATYTPQKPVKTVSFYLLLRKSTGSATFRDPIFLDSARPNGWGASRPSPIVGAPRIQATVPEGYKEVPFVDPNPAPERTAEEKARGYMLFARSIMQPVYGASRPLAAERVESLSAFATPGEYEPLSFAIYPLRDVNGLRVQVSELRSGAHTIATNDIDLRLVTEWPMRFPNYNSKGTYRRQPELLEAVTTHSFAKGESQRYWIRLHVPPGAQPGLYQGSVSLVDSSGINPVTLPIHLRVLPFELTKDPRKRYSVYYYNPAYQFRDIPETLLDRAMDNELSAMLAYGIDMFPTIPLRAVKKDDGNIELVLTHPKFLEKMMAKGFRGPIPLIGGIELFYSKHVPGGKNKGHWVVEKEPEGNAMYEEIETAFRKFRLEYAAKGFPEFICCPMDEVSPTSADFASKVYGAIRKSGMRTFITKDPASVDSAIYREREAVDAWCSQPFAFPFGKVTQDKRFEYWSYPNHNAGEIKDRVTQQKGGRMTYGFGFWRSGYTTLIPWHWRWMPYQEDSFDYLRDPQNSGCGQRMDEMGNVIPSIYWECFREGYDDARYLYTLEQAIFERETATEKKCLDSVNRGRALLQKIWDETRPQEKYLSVGLWPDAQFEAVRWRLARAIIELSQFPSLRKGVAPSPMVDPKEKGEGRGDAFAQAATKGLLITRDLCGDDFSGWRPLNTEVTTALVKSEVTPARSSLRMTVKVDHLVDGGGENGKYPVGWPRIRKDYELGEIDLAGYDFLTFMVRVDSDRDEVADDNTPIIVSVISHDGGPGGLKQDIPLDLGDRQRTWLPVRLSISDLIQKSGRDAAAWKNLKAIQFVISEGQYKHGTRLVFDLDRFELVKVKHPLIDSLGCADAVIFPSTQLAVSVKGIGFQASPESPGTPYRLALSFKSGAVEIASRQAPLDSADSFYLGLPPVVPGAYFLEARVLDRQGKAVSTMAKKIDVIEGFGP